ncbi:MAG: YabP/YqfC family sporulation protein [Clostridia bacterium]|nr:YabP/YqfC family sporulation protein [Clostridia bacterium]
MFIDETQEILKIGNKVFPYTLTLLGGECAVVSGVKTIILSSQTEIKLRVKGGILRIAGNGLSIRQMGGADMYLSGEVESVEVEKK